MTSKPNKSTAWYIDNVQLGASIEKALFARRDLKKGDFIFFAKGSEVSINVRNATESALYPNALGLRRNVWLNPFKTNPLRYVNHSCSPNAGIKGSVTFIARSPIKSGEQITIDYSTTECDERWELGITCQCGAKNCRKTIRSIQYLPYTVFKKYLPYIPTAMQAEYYKAHQL